jgi:cyclophilin family peptidyl-prolyl cis-trans isomerase
MKMNNKVLVAIAALVIVVAVAAVLILRQGAPSAGDTVQDSAVVPATQTPGETTSPTTPAAQEQTKMANYDLTPGEDGLSKATATLTLEKGGVIKWKFYTNDAPNTVKRISQLISEGFYNGIIFHRVVPGFVVQAGDPNGLGNGGSGVKLKAEFNKRKHEPGILSMARTADPNSADSQFFIMLGTHQHLDGQYTVFGKVVEGYENVPNIVQGDKIKSFTIE